MLVKTRAAKFYDIDHAARTAIYHSQNAIVIRHNVNDWPVILAFPSTPVVARLYLHIPVAKAMWQVQIAEFPLHNFKKYINTSPMVAQCLGCSFTSLKRTYF